MSASDRMRGLSFVLTLASCFAGIGGSAGCSRVTTPDAQAVTLMVDGVARDVLVHVPKGIVSERRPAVIMIHGTADTGETALAESGWREVADTEGFVVAFPTALVHCHKEDKNFDGDFDDPDELVVATKWAAGTLGTDVMPLCNSTELATRSTDEITAAAHPLANDLGFFDAQVELLTQEYRIDPKRIYVAGFSNGAQMTATLALRRADRFAAAAPHAGTLFPLYNPDDVMPSRRMLIVESVGEKDQIFAAPLGVDRLPLDDDMANEVPQLWVDFVLPMLTMAGLESDYTYRATQAREQPIGVFEFSQRKDPTARSLSLFIIGDLAHRYPNGTAHPFGLAQEVWARWKDERLP